jgi:hypothetical protein
LVAQALAERLGVHHVDVDALFVDLLAAGIQPDPADGWRAWVKQRVVAALDTHQVVRGGNRGLGQRLAPGR